MERKRIGILGCGWYGLAMAKALLGEGFPVNGSTTSTHKLPGLRDTGIRPFLIDLSDKHQIDPAFFDCDIIICCIPPADAGKFSTSLQNLIHELKAAGVRQLIWISSIGVYGNRNSFETEATLPRPDTEKGHLLLHAENELKDQPGFTTTILRFGGLTGPGRDLSRYFAGKTDLPDGLAPVNLIHLDDCVGITQAIIRKEAFGYGYNGVFPQHPCRADFYSRICERAGLEQPVFIPEKRSWKQVDSMNIPRFLAYRWRTEPGSP